MKEARTREIQSSSHRCGVERRLEQIWVFKMELLIRCAAGVWDRSSSLPGETTPSICSDTIALKHTGKENTHQAQKQSRSISKSWHSWHSLKNDLSLSFHYHTKFFFFFFSKVQSHWGNQTGRDLSSLLSANRKPHVAVHQHISVHQSSSSPLWWNTWTIV